MKLRNRRVKVYIGLMDDILKEEKDKLVVDSYPFHDEDIDK